MKCANIYEKYLVEEKLPTMWCPGCGNGIVLQSIIRAIDEMDLDHDKIVFVSGIGCSSRAVNYLKFDCMHTNHGRAIAFATGIKMANPDLKVIVLKDGGIPQGRHHVKLTLKTRRSYTPTMVAVCEKDLTFA